MVNNTNYLLKQIRRHLVHCKCAPAKIRSESKSSSVTLETAPFTTAIFCLDTFIIWNIYFSGLLKQWRLHNRTGKIQHMSYSIRNRLAQQTSTISLCSPVPRELYVLLSMWNYLYQEPSLGCINLHHHILLLTPLYLLACCCSAKNICRTDTRKKTRSKESHILPLPGWRRWLNGKLWMKASPC